MGSPARCVPPAQPATGVATMSLILIVDDDATTRSALAEPLVRAGHSVLEVGDGRAALNLARRADFDCAIVDLFMPDMDGIETLQALTGEHPDLPVICLLEASRSDLNVMARVAGLLGAARTLHKPVPAERVQEAVAALLGATPAEDPFARPVSPTGGLRGRPEPVGG